MNRAAPAAALAAVVTLSASPAFADEVSKAFTGAPQSAPLPDAALDGQRGRLVLPAGSLRSVGAPLLPPARTAAAATAAAGSVSSGAAAAKAAPANLGSAGGQVLYFGFELTSQWTTHGTGGATTYTAAQAVGIDVAGARPSVTIGSWTARSGNGTAAAGSGTIDGTPGDGRIAGVGQTIQIAGNGNSVVNGATIDVSSVRQTFVLAPTSGGTGCGSACSVSTGPQGVGVAIDLPGGSVAQGLANGSLYQNVRVTSDGNAIANQMKMSLQTAPGAARTFLAPANLIPPTLQLSH